MRLKRHQKAERNINFYCVNFGFRKPFQILVDGTFCMVSAQNRVQLREDLPKYLNGEVKLLTTQCVIIETETLGPTVRPAMHIVKSFGIHKCGHNKKPISGANCIISMTKDNVNTRYIVATQDKSLQNILYNIPAVPVMYFNGLSIVLKSPSPESLNLANQRKQSRFQLTDHESKVLTHMKSSSISVKIPSNEDSTSYPGVFKRAKGPNPLSCKKKKKKSVDETIIPKVGNSTKRKRHRVKIPKHVIEELRNKACDS
ncbi:rRNA-processing protein UTP23 homolog [Daktulosphaira vitifoliae]|uniref:rRNA-processing protein UTP23 homolog n=1 Tax=Daktulosphaira vitifoliae TaxID=58002 RepID=UPI0021A9D3F5|nr:rRNA-processing protein UTP23 homolog [Daktulosphaira vitifoliae]